MIIRIKAAKDLSRDLWANLSSDTSPCSLDPIQSNASPALRVLPDPLGPVTDAVAEALRFDAEGARLTASSNSCARSSACMDSAVSGCCALYLPTKINFEKDKKSIF